MSIRPLILLVMFFATLISSAVRAERPYVVAHRGLLRHAPENTLAGFRACLELRLGFELDVQRSRDGHLICIHDDTVDRTTNGSGRVSELTLAQLKELDAGSWLDPAFQEERVPTIDEVFATLAEYPHDVLVTVDLKASRVEEDAVRLAAKHGVLDRLLFIGTTIRTPDVRERIKRTAADARIAAVANSAEQLPDAMAAPGVDWVYVRYVPSEAEVARIHKADQKVILVGPTVSAAEVENWKAAAQNRVDAILTDHSLALRRALAE